VVNLIVATPLSRKGNLPMLRTRMAWLAGQLNWVLSEQLSMPLVWAHMDGSDDPYGHATRNKILSGIEDPDDWIYWLDDDNLIEWPLVEFMAAHADSNAEAYVFRQHRRGMIVPAAIGVGVADMGQVAARRRAYGDLRFVEGDRQADGLMFVAMQEAGVKFVPVHRALTYYNALRPNA
jgi:hypothetical protein